MKTRIIVFLLAVFTLCLAVVSNPAEIYAGEHPKVFLDGKLISFPDQQPIVEDETIYVPLRYFLEQQDIKGQWDAQSRSVSATINNELIKITVGSSAFSKNGKVEELSQPARTDNGKVFVPIDFLSDIFGFKVEFGVGKELTAHITAQQKVWRLSPDLSIEKIKDQVFVVTHSFPWPANSLVVEMDDSSIVLVDTPYTPSATDELLKWVTDEFGERSIVAINTHFHFDNLGGNQALIDEKIPIYGSDLTQQLIDERGESARKLILSWLIDPKAERYYKEFEKIPYCKATEVFSINEAKVLTFGKEKVEIYYPGEGHSLDNTVVNFPDKNILFGGCMIKSLEDQKLGNVADANIEEWPNSVTNVLKKYPDPEFVIPGHGLWGGRELLEHTLNVVSPK